MKYLLNALFSFVVVFNITFFSPVHAKADLFGDILDKAAQAGGWPSDLPSPQALIKLIEVAQGCTSATDEAGLIACVNTAIQDPTIYNALGSDTVDKIDKAIDVYVAISNSDYITLISILGQTAGCAAATILTGVPVCAMAQLIADLAGAIADVAQEIYEFLQSVGAHAKITGPDYYDLFFYPYVSLGVQINLFTNSYQVADKFGELVGPMYNGCYHYFRDIDDMSKSNAKKTCEILQNQFVAEINAEIAKMEAAGQKAIGVEYDKLKIDWQSIWKPKCNLSAGATSDVDGTQLKCENDVDVVLEKGKTKAMSYVKNCLKSDAMIYDTVGCAKAGYNNIFKELESVVAENEKLEQAFKNNPNSGPNVLAKLKYELEQFNKEAGAWANQCNYAINQGDCRTEVKRAWDHCQVRVAKEVPWEGDVVGYKQEKIDAVKKSCEPAYAAVVSTYGSFVNKYLSMYDLEKLCPANYSVPLFPQASANCKTQIHDAAIRCAGGVPVFTEAFYKNGKISQKPEPGNNCDGDKNAFKEIWGQDESLLTQVDTVLQGAKSICEQVNNDCREAVIADAESCKIKIEAKANALGVLPVVPAYQGDRAKALKAMQTTAASCTNAIVETAKDFVQTKALEIMTLQTYESKCPAFKALSSLHDDCKAALLAAIHKCEGPKLSITGGNRSTGKRSSNQKFTGGGDTGDSFTKNPLQKIMNQCQGDLEAVISDYSKKYANSQPDLSKNNAAKLESKLLDAPKASKEGDKPELRNAPEKNKRKILLGAPEASPKKEQIELTGKKGLISNLAVDAEEKPAEEAPKHVRADLTKKAPLVRMNPNSTPTPTKESGGKAGAGDIPPVPAFDPIKQMQNKGCTAIMRGGGGYSCKTDEGFKACETLKLQGKVKACQKVN